MHIKYIRFVAFIILIFALMQCLALEVFDKYVLDKWHSLRVVFLLPNRKMTCQQAVVNCSGVCVLLCRWRNVTILSISCMGSSSRGLTHRGLSNVDQNVKIFIHSKRTIAHVYSPNCLLHMIHVICGQKKRRKEKQNGKIPHFMIIMI